MTQQEWEVLNSTMGYSPQQDTAIRESGLLFLLVIKHYYLRQLVGCLE